MERGLGVTPRRPERVADLIRHELARVLREEVRDPAVGFVTLTDVDLSPDLRNARVFLTVLGQDENATLRALRRAKPFIRRSLARRTGLRFTPELTFVLDESVASGSRVENLLREIRRERAERTDSDTEGPRAPDEDPTEPGESA